MEPRKTCRRISDPKERLRIVLLSLQAEVNKSELCEKKAFIFSNWCAGLRRL